jgi:hypothetical protein
VHVGRTGGGPQRVVGGADAARVVEVRDGDDALRSVSLLAMRWGSRA